MDISIESYLKIKMSTPLVAAKSFPGLRIGKPEDPKTPKNPINFGLTRKSPRCAQCLKFQADDPSNIGEDEVKDLKRCMDCKKVQYCSRNCQKINYHPTTSNIILEYMKNKKGFPVEKNFYVSLSGLPQKSHYLFDDKTWACDCHDCMPRSRKKKNQIKNHT